VTPTADGLTWANIGVRGFVWKTTLTNTSPRQMNGRRIAGFRSGPSDKLHLQTVRLKTASDRRRLTVDSLTGGVALKTWLVRTRPYTPRRTPSGIKPAALRLVHYTGHGAAGVSEPSDGGCNTLAFSRSAPTL
jgi:hypothetical protein